MSYVGIPVFCEGYFRRYVPMFDSGHTLRRPDRAEQCQPRGIRFYRRGTLQVKLSRTAAYAISALLQLSEYPPDSPVSCRRLAMLRSLPERFLLQVLRSLVNRGLLTSSRGVEGGYTLARPLSDISLLQVIEAVDSPIAPVLPQVEALPVTARPHLTDVLGVISADTAKRLAAVSMADLKSSSTGPTRIDLRTSVYDLFPIIAPS